MTIAPVRHSARAHALIRRRLFERAREYFPDHLGREDWDPSDPRLGRQDLGLGRLDTDALAPDRRGPGGWDPSDPGNHSEDLGQGLLDAYALALHVLWTYQEAWAREGFLSLAKLDVSVNRLLAQIAYRPAPGSAAIGLQHFRCTPEVTAVLPAGFRVVGPSLGDEPDAVYETLAPLRLDPSLNEVRAFSPETMPGATSGAGSDASGSGSDGSADSAGDSTSSTGVASTGPLPDALQERLGAGLGGDLAAREARRARAEMRKLSEVMRRMKEAGVEECTSVKDYLCEQLCAAQEAAAMGVHAPGPLTESQELALRQLRKLARQQQSAIDALEKALARCADEADEAYRERLDAMSSFLDAFVSGLVQDARDQVVLLRGAGALARMDRAFGDLQRPSALGSAAPGTDTLHLAIVDAGRIGPGTLDVRTGDWFVLAEDVERVDDAGRAFPRRVYREAIQVVSVSEESIDGVQGRFTRITFSPKLQRRYRLDRTVLVGNLAMVSHGSTVVEDATVSLDGRSLTLSEGPLTWLRSPRDPNGRRPELKVLVDGREWERVTHLLASPRTATVYAVEPLADGRARVRFGDGINGAVVPTRASIRLEYRVGIGSSANRDPGAVDRLMDSHAAVESTLNPFPLRGGTQPEPREQAKVRAPAALRAMDRAVSLSDVRALVLTFDGIQRAQVRRGARRGRIRVIVSGFDGQPVDDLGAVRRFLQVRVAPGVVVEVAHAAPVYVHAEITLQYVAGANPIDVIRDARIALGAESHPDRPEGLLHPDNTTLGQDLTLSEVYAALEKVPKLRSCRVDRLYRQSLSKAGVPVPLSEIDRVLADVVVAAPNERLLWAPSMDGVDGLHLTFEEATDQ